MADGEETEPQDQPSPMPPDPFALGQASFVHFNEAYRRLRSGGFSMIEALVFLAASDALNTMIAAQEAAVILAREMPEQPGEE